MDDPKTEDNLLVPPLEMYSRLVNGTLKTFPNNYLDKEAIKEIVRHLILNVYHYTREDVLEKVNHKFFQDNHIGGARKFFEKGDMEMLVYSFPEWDLKYWEFNKVFPGFWKNEEYRKEFVLWVADKEKLDVNKKEDLRKITVEVIYKYGGYKAIKLSGGTFELLNLVAKDKYKKWEIIAMSCWSDEEAIEATKWLIETKLQYTPEQVCGIKTKDFVAHNLAGMLQKKFNHSVFKALDMAYPGVYKKEGLREIRLNN